MSNKWVYLFEEGNADMRNLLGGKGANLAEMTNLGLPIPPNITTVAGQYHKRYRIRFLLHFQIWKQSRGKNSGIRRIRYWFPFVPEQGRPCRV